jgi:hypothetical protein
VSTLSLNIRERDMRAKARKSKPDGYLETQPDVAALFHEASAFSNQESAAIHAAEGIPTDAVPGRRRRITED